MELTGWLMKAEVYGEESVYPRVYLQEHGRRIATICLDLLEDVPEALTAVDVECLYILIDERLLYVLLLRETSIEREYKRIGVATADPVWFGNGGARKESIAII